MFLRRNKLTIVRGLPGAGKSKYASELGCRHFEADMYFELDGEYKFDYTKLAEAHAWCKFITGRTLEREDVVVSNTFTTVREVIDYVDIAEEKGCDLEIIELLHNYGSIHDVPEATMKRMKARWVSNAQIDKELNLKLYSFDVKLTTIGG